MLEALSAERPELLINAIVRPTLEATRSAPPRTRRTASFGTVGWIRRSDRLDDAREPYLVELGGRLPRGPADTLSSRFVEGFYERALVPILRHTVLVQEIFQGGYRLTTRI